MTTAMESLSPTDYPWDRCTSTRVILAKRIGFDAARSGKTLADAFCCLDQCSWSSERLHRHLIEGWLDGGEL
jgi:hypothetical protein